MSISFTKLKDYMQRNQYTNHKLLTIVLKLLISGILLMNGELIFAQLDCANAPLITIGKTIQGNTTNGKNNNSKYNNDNFWQNTGPEDVYKLDWPGGDASFKLSNKTAALDLIIIGACDPGNYIAGGANTGTNEFTFNANLPAGTYYIVIDGWQSAKGSYDLIVSIVRQAVTILPRTFYLLSNDSTLYELTGSTSKVLLSGVESIGNYFGYVTNPVTGEGRQDAVLGVKRYGHALPKVFLDENFNTDYLKQKLSCPQKNLTLYGEQVFDGNKEILTGCDLLRCENGHTLSHQQDGKIKLLNNNGNTWLDIIQIITIADKSYYIKQSDSSVWALNGNQAVLIGTKARLLQENDNDLIKINVQGNYQRWNGTLWTNLTPKYTSVSPAMTDEAFWFFIQAKPLLESTDIQTNHKKGLTFDKNDQLKMELIPATGNCDRFLWKTVDAGAGKRILINKAKGDSTPLLMAASGTLTFAPGQGVKEWEIKQSDINKYGTNAFQLIGANATNALTYNSVFGAVQTTDPIAGNKNQTWLFQFNQMVKDYFLPLPTKANLLTHYVDNPNVNVNTAADAIGASYNKFLKGINGITFFATNTSSDWVLVNYYFIINNMLKAVITPKPSDSRVDPNTIKTLDALKGQSLVLINKNDLNAAIPNQFLTTWQSKQDASRLRGSSAYLSPQKAILASEELTCKTGIVNRPLDNTNRRFDHGVHEFAHALQELCGYIPIVDANNMCPSEAGRSSECFCFDIQTWFNSNAPAYHFPGLRAFDARRSNFMSKFFNVENTWMPAADIRQDGYNPSSAPSISLSAQTFSSSLCDSAFGYKVKNCTTANDAQFQSISVAGLPSNLSNDYGLKSIYIEAAIPGKLASIQPYIDLIDPKGVQHRLFNPQSFPQFDGSKQEFKVTFSACNSAGIPNANVNQPFLTNGFYKPMGDNPLNKVNLSNVNLNGDWKLSLCTAEAFTLKCFKLDFGPTCPTLKNHKIVTDNCKSFVQVLFNDINNPFCDDQDGNFLPDYYIKIAGSKDPITTWDYANHLKLAVPQGISKIEFGTYYKNSQGIEYYSCPQIFEVDVPISDTVKPSIQNCPANATVTLDTDGKVNYTLQQPIFSDNCGTPKSLLNIYFLDGATDLGGGVQYKNLTTYPDALVPYVIKGIGRQVFEFMTTDAAGNSATCTTVITSLPNPNSCSFNPSISVSEGNCTNTPITAKDISGAVRIDWMNGNQLVKTSVLDSTPTKEGITVAGTGKSGNTNTELGWTAGVAIDKAGNLYVCDSYNHRVLKFAPGATSGVIVAGGNGAGSGLNQLLEPNAIHLDKEDNLYVSDGNHRVTKWSPGATSGKIVAGGNLIGNATNQLHGPSSIYVDANGNLYVADTRNYRIQKWVPGAINGITVAGTGVKGIAANQLIEAYGVIVNEAGEIFVVEYELGRVKKFPANSTQGTNGIIVANDKLGVTKMTIDAAGYIYITNSFENYVKKFPPNRTSTTAGVIVSGGNGRGSGANQLDGPNGITVDANGNIYIADQFNYRVQKWAQTASALSNTFTPTTAGIYSAEITRADGCKSNTNTLEIVECKATPQVVINGGCMQADQSGLISVTVKGFTKILAMEFTLQPSVTNTISLESITNPYFPNILYNKLPNGDLKIVWDDATGQEISLPDGTKLFDIVVKSTANFNTPVIISGTDQVIVSTENSSLTIIPNSISICASTVLSPKGRIADKKDKPHFNAKVSLSLSSKEVAETNTGTDGRYTFNPVPATHRITPSDNSDIRKGVNIADVSLVRRLSLSIPVFSDNYSLVAADVNKDGVINIADVSILNRVVLQMNNEFPNNTSWRFLPKKLDISSNPLKVDWPGYIDMSQPNLDYNSLDFVSIKVGDVNGSALSLNENLVTRSASTLSIPDTNLAFRTNMKIPLRYSGDEKITAFTLKIKYDKDNIKLVKIESSTIPGFGTQHYNEKNGTIIISYDHPQGMDFTPTDVLMNLVFDHVTSTGLTALDLSDVLFLDKNLSEIGLQSKNGSVNFLTSSVHNKSNSATIKSYPNPFTEAWHLDIRLATPDKVNIDIMDIAGRVLRQIPIQKVSELHHIVLDDLHYHGLINCKITTSKITYTLKAIKL